MTAWPVDPRGQVVQQVAIITGLFFVRIFGLHAILGFQGKNHGGNTHSLQKLDNKERSDELPYTKGHVLTQPISHTPWSRPKTRQLRLPVND